MSEKLYKVVEAVDLLDGDDPIPKRYLVFMDSDGNQIKAFFPKDRMTLILDGKLYDWYGHEAELGPDITEVLSHYGCHFTDTYRDGKAYETFVVRRNDDRLLIATLYYSNDFRAMIRNFAKVSSIGRIMYEKPFLSSGDWSFAKFREPPTANSCLHEINDQIYKKSGSMCKICIDVTTNHSHHDIVFDKTHEEFNHPCWVEHRIVKTRDSILNPNGELHLSGATERTSLDGDLMFSEDGEKMTAFIYSPSTKRYARVSTDTEVIRRMEGDYFRGIYWYYDHEPES